MLLCDHIICSLEWFGHDIYAGPSGPPTRFCDIYSPNLTTSGTVLYIANDTKNVILYCICKRRNNVAVGPTTWFINGTAVTTTASGNYPYYRNNVPSPLIIPSFTPTLVGTYGCGGYYPTEPNVTINLTISGIYLYLLLKYL